eukprot:Gb_16312 [translate_table: standard]
MLNHMGLTSASNRFCGSSPQVTFRRWSRWYSNIEDKGSGNAYEVLGVARNCTDVEIKSAFRKLAKETHPDLHVHSDFMTNRFVHILAAYEILSDPQKRAQYDDYLLFEMNKAENNFEKYPDISTHDHKFHRVSRVKQMEVVEWLKWYRCAVNGIVLHKELGLGSGLHEYLRSEFYAAIRAAYFGPAIDTTNVLPDCFEAEERSQPGISEVLHLVSGRNLFGVVCFADRTFVLPHERFSGVPHLQSLTMQTQTSLAQVHTDKKAKNSDHHSFSEKNTGFLNYYKDKHQIRKNSGYLEFVWSDAYKDLELHLFGKTIARATRVPPNPHCSTLGKDSQDSISVFLEMEQTVSDTEPLCMPCSDSEFCSSGLRRVLVGTIYGLGVTPSEGACFVHGADGRKTHMIMQHRTPLVKHMHWYQVGQKAAACECRCTRARLPPSKFWIFEPRCENHDIGGWYVETFGRDKKGQAMPSNRHWQSLNDISGSEFMEGSSRESSEGTLHPAVYIMALAYRTLDLEAAQSKNKFVTDILKDNLDLRSMTSNLFLWCKRKLAFMKWF